MLDVLKDNAVGKVKAWAGKDASFVTAHGDHFPSGQTHSYWVEAKIINDKKY